MKKKLINFMICLLAFVVGIAGGAIYVTYQTLPNTENLIVGEETYYTYNDHGEVESVELSGEEGEFSIHFLELGNKYTGDCTFIKVGNIDILIDCGSKSNSISTVSNYLNNYVTDGILEYVIVTHSHQDHYAGFATSVKIQSIFDLYECKTIIDFGNASNQKATATVFNNYLRERNAEIAAGATHYPASSLFGANPAHSPTFELTADISFDVLYNKHYMYDREDPTGTADYKAGSDNDYSVCTMFKYGEKYFLLTGDLENEEGAEEAMVENEYNKDLFDMLKAKEGYGVELYKAGHHGSKTSSSPVLMEHIRPKTVCVCCCAGSSEYTDTVNNQFPTQEFINNVAPYTANIFVTTLCVDYDNDQFTSMNGNIVIIAKKNDNVVYVNCSNNQTILKETEWFNRTIIVDGVERAMRTWPANGVQWKWTKQWI